MKEKKEEKEWNNKKVRFAHENGRNKLEKWKKW